VSLAHRPSNLSLFLDNESIKTPSAFFVKTLFLILDFYSQKILIIIKMFDISNINGKITQISWMI
jgi:hypothetical protein